MAMNYWTAKRLRNMKSNNFFDEKGHFTQAGHIAFGHVPNMRKLAKFEDAMSEAKFTSVQHGVTAHVVYWNRYYYVDYQGTVLKHGSAIHYCTFTNGVFSDPVPIENKTSE